MKHVLLGSLLLVLCTTGCNRSPERDYSLLVEPSFREDPACHFDKERGYTVCDPQAKTSETTSKSSASRVGEEAAPGLKLKSAPDTTVVQIDTVGGDDATPEWLFDIAEDTPVWAGAAATKKPKHTGGDGESGKSSKGNARQETGATTRLQRSAGSAASLGGGGGAGGFGGGGGGGAAGGPITSSQEVANNLAGSRDAADAANVANTTQQQETNETVTSVPEPTSVVLLGTGLVLLGLHARWNSRRRRLEK